MNISEWRAFCIHHRLPILLACLSALLLITGGCATSQSGPGYFLRTKSDAIVYVDPSAPPIRKVALLPFKAPTELIGGSVSELFITELLKAGRYTLVERAQISKILSESELSMSGMTSAQAVEVGSMVGADGVIIGTVDQYETQSDKGRIYPVIGITLRLIDCSTSKIAWSVDLASRAEDKNSSLAVHSREVVHEMMSGLYRDLMKYLPPDDPKDVKTSDMDLRKAVITWSRTSESGITYIIERSDSMDGTYTEVGRTDMSRGCYTDSGLEDTKSYCYKITAQSRNGVRSQPSAPVETFTSPPPAPVTTPKAQSDLVRSVILTWRPPAETRFITGYQVHKALSEAGLFEKTADIRGIDNTEYTDGGREPGKLNDASEYFYKIVAVNEAGAISEKATIISATTRSAPPPVKSFTAQSNCPREIPLSWEPSDDEKVAGYTITRLDPATGQYNEIANITGRNTAQYTDRNNVRNTDKLGGLNDDTEYRYQIAAYNIGNTRSPFSQPCVGKTKKAPAEPAEPSVKSGMVKAIHLTWNPNPEPDISQYAIEYCEAGSDKFRECGKAESCEFEHTGLKDGTTYTYHIKAIDKDRLESIWSITSVGTTKPIPNAPSALTYEAQDSGYKISWTPPDQKDVVSYRVFAKNLLFKKEIGVSEINEYLLSNEQVGKAIEIYVTSIDQDKLESDFSNPLIITSAISE